MTELAWKLRVAVLWVFLSVTVLTSLVAYVYEPETVRGIMRGEVAGVDPGSTEAQMTIALQPLGAMAVAFTTLTLSNPRTNRMVNGVLASLAALQAFLATVRSFEEPSAFLTGVMVLVSLLVLWHVWKWPVPSRAASAAHEGDPARH
jgi:hypothetical protein